VTNTEVTMTTAFLTFLRAVSATNDRDGILGSNYLVYPPTPDFGYDATPRNALTFAAMGVDGVHYAIVTTRGVTDDASPVIEICPMDFDQVYAVLGESFLDYLATGCGVGAAEMESILDTERATGNHLIPFLRERFRHSRMLGDARLQSLAHHLGRVDRKV
jgi:hypothetical protein